jgi:hypothetical protein
MNNDLLAIKPHCIAIPIQDDVDKVNQLMPATPSPKIEFTSHVSPFVSLISHWNKTGYNLKLKTFTWLHHSYDLIIRLIRKLFIQKTLEPTHPHFIELLERFDTQLANLNIEVGSLRLRFKYPALLFKDLQKIQSIYYQIHETIAQIDYFAKHINLFASHPSIQEDLGKLREAYGEARHQFQIELMSKAPAILDTFDTVYENFTPHCFAMPERIRQEFEIAARIIKETVIDYTDVISVAQKKHFLDRMHRLKKMAEENQIVSRDLVERPLPLKNIGNSCYLDAVLQVLFCLPKMREKLYLDLKEERLDDYKDLPPQRLQILREEKKLELAKRKDVQRQLIHLIHSVPQHSSLTQYYLRVKEDTKPLIETRRAIFESDLNRLEFPINRIGSQLDSAFVLELLMRYILDESFLTQRVESTREIPGRVFYSKPELSYTLSVELNNKYCDLQSIIESTFAPVVVEDDGRKFIPCNGIKTGDEDVSIPLDQPVRPNTLAVMYRLKSLPDVMAVHLKRFQYNPLIGRSIKLDNPVKLPSDGTINLESIYAPAARNPEETTRYKIMGYIVHYGHSVEGGHFIARVRIGDEYYHCNDLDPVPYSRISEDEFYREDQPYIILLAPKS